jgi:hypothetical protein
MSPCPSTRVIDRDAPHAEAGTGTRHETSPAQRPPLRSRCASLCHGISKHTRRHSGPATRRRGPLSVTADVLAGSGAGGQSPPLEGGRVVRWRGPRAHATVVHGCAIAHTAEAMPPRCPGRHRLAHAWSNMCACLRSRPRTGQCSGGCSVAAGLPPWTAGLPGAVPAPHRLGNALDRTPRLASPHRPPGGSQGRHRRRCALPVPLVPVTPHPPHEGVLQIAPAPEGARACLAGLAWAGVHPGGWAPPDPCQPHAGSRTRWLRIMFWDFSHAG